MEGERSKAALLGFMVGKRVVQPVLNCYPCAALECLAGYKMQLAGGALGMLPDVFLTWLGFSRIIAVHCHCRWYLFLSLCLQSRKVCKTSPGRTFEKTVLHYLLFCPLLFQAVVAGEKPPGGRLKMVGSGQVRCLFCLHSTSSLSVEANKPCPLM